ncbi:hypothetical protein ACE6H2_013086 [Prunus campanulata]
MSKKKVSGNTMTLKDFHGGSIPSDLPLPSAPGVVVRPTDRSTYDRPTSWGNPMGRPDHRSRPHTSPATRHFDDKTPFLTHSVHIGRNFDEDERKPLDGVSTPRRTISDDSIRVFPTRAEPKPVFVSSGGLSGAQGWAPAPQSPRGAVSSYSERVSEAAHAGVNSQTLSANGGRGVSGAHPNAWAMRKEMAGVTETVQSAWSGQSAVQKLANASALDKVSSGRWQSKSSIPYQTNIDVVISPETESGLHSKGYGNDTYKRTDVMVEREHHDVALARHVERGLQVDDGIQGVMKELPDYRSSGAPINSEVQERNATAYSNRVQPAQADGKFGQAELQASGSPEPVERPKLKLLPRTKPVDGLEAPVVDHAQEYQRVIESHVEIVNDVYGNMNSPKPGSAGSDSGKQVVERPKLNLKPRSQPLEQLEGNAKRDRISLFGGARPRELVLKERGVDDVVITNIDMVQHSDKVEHQVPKPDRVPVHANPTRHNEKPENHPFDQRTGKKFDRRDNRVDVERVDGQKRNWRNDGKRNNREPERQQQQSERPPSPETWRKPEQPKLSSPGAVGVHHGKAASALELAQAFSRSVSDPKLADRFSGQRGIPGRAQMPFSRLMGPTPRPQINGY